MLKIKSRTIFGFTLIELSIVVALIGMLSVAGGASYVGALRSSRDARRKSDLTQIKSALELYRADNSKYPVSLTDLSLPKKYINVPKDPINQSDYAYISCIDSTCDTTATPPTSPCTATSLCPLYKLGAKLESDSATCIDKSVCNNPAGVASVCTYCLDPYGEF